MKTIKTLALGLLIGFLASGYHQAWTADKAIEQQQQFEASFFYDAAQELKGTE